MLSVRPQISKLTFHLFGRSLHPELFEVQASRSSDREHYQVRYQITSAGHIVSANFGGIVLTELSAAAQQPLPQQRLLMSHDFGGRRTDQIVYGDRIRYQCDFQLEQVDGRCLLAFQQALSQQTECDGLLYQFQHSGRLAVGAMSYVNVETRCRSIRVRAFHTFPDSCAMVKSSSLIELL
jgi:hypothetical protein